MEAIRGVPGAIMNIHIKSHYHQFLPLFSIILFTILSIAKGESSSGSGIINSKTIFPKYEPSTFQRVPLNKLPKLENDLLLRAATNQHTPRVPVWCMRQAGRHLPEFKEISSKYDFFEMCQNPNIAVEVSLQPLRRYNVDAVIIFSDILVIPQAMGMDITMVKGKGPVFTNPLRTPKDISLYNLNLNPNVDTTLCYVLDALNLARQKINGQVPLIGFVGGPLSLLMFMVEGESPSNKSMKKLKFWLYTYPKECHALLNSITDICIAFLIAQQKAGAQVLQVFESVGVESLTQCQYYEFVFPYLKRIAESVKDACPDTPLIMFSKGTDYAFERLAETRFDCLGLDWTSSPEDVRSRIENVNVNINANDTNSNSNTIAKALQGNLDPCVIYADVSTIESEVEKMLKSFGTKGYIANFGHGCFPDMDPKHVDAFIKCVQQKSLLMNQS
jgi:uroporphyrinogen decarboxylase